jgi:hypothetical protein
MCINDKRYVKKFCATRPSRMSSHIPRITKTQVHWDALEAFSRPGFIGADNVYGQNVNLTLRLSVSHSPRLVPHID